MSNCEFVIFPLVSWVGCGTVILFDSLRWRSGYLGEKKAELQKLPPPRAVFLEGVKRAQYQCIIWKTSSVINPDKSMPDNYEAGLW